MDLSFSAIRRHWSCDSMTHGPEMMSRGWFFPTVWLAMEMVLGMDEVLGG